MKFFIPLTQRARRVSGILIGIALGYFALSAKTHAVSPPPDGCYPNFTTAEGCDALSFLATGVGNTGLGWRSLFFDSTGSFNTGVGGGALALNNADSNTAVGAAALLLNTTGGQNTAVGTDALVFNDSGSDNSAVGAFALFNNTGSGNTAVGASALFSNMDGVENVALGADALVFNDSGSDNNAVGAFALNNNIDGSDNNALGAGALLRNIHAAANTAIGSGALGNNDVTGAGVANDNTAVGASALFQNTDGDSNTAVGFEALFDNDTGTQNTAVGDSALASNVDGNFNNGFGFAALVNNVSGNQNTAIGYSAGEFITGDGNVCIGQGVLGTSGENGHTRIRNIGSTPIVGGTTVVVAGTGGIGDDFLGYNASSRRYKQDIKAMDNASERLFALKPVSFQAKGDPTHIRHYGLIAEDVAKVDPDLAVYNPQGQPETLRFDAINAMLLNEFLKEHQAFVEEQCKIEQQQKEIDSLKAELREQRTLIQKVSDKVELSQPTAKVAVHNP